jgi:hypothetical protein
MDFDTGAFVPLVAHGADVDIDDFEWSPMLLGDLAIGCLHLTKREMIKREASAMIGAPGSAAVLNLREALKGDDPKTTDEALLASLLASVASNLRPRWIDHGDDEDADRELIGFDLTLVQERGEPADRRATCGDVEYALPPALFRIRRSAPIDMPYLFNSDPKPFRVKPSSAR